MILPTLDIENSLWQKGYRYIVGIDEVGRGSWAGPLVAAGVILPFDYQIPEGLADVRFDLLIQRELNEPVVVCKRGLSTPEPFVQLSHLPGKC